MTLDFHVMIVEYLKRETKTAAYSVLLTPWHYPRRFCKEQSSFTAFLIVLSVTWQPTTVNRLLRVHNGTCFSQCAWMTVRYDIISEMVLKLSPGLRFLICIYLFIYLNKKNKKITFCIRTKSSKSNTFCRRTLTVVVAQKHLVAAHAVAASWHDPPD